jgi:multisubunit Na+/H+ antiporter MnhE subunit
MEISLPMARARRLADRAVHHVGPWAGWWVASMLLWLLLTSTVNGSEAIAGVGASCVAATAGEVVRANRAFGFRARLRWLRSWWRIPIQLVHDTATVIAVLMNHLTGRRRVRGMWRAVPFRHGKDDDPEDAARRTLATIAVTISPNSYVVGVDPDRDELLVHQLTDSPEDVERIIGSAAT